MFKIEIRSDDGREAQISPGNFLYYREENGKEHFFEWNHFTGRDQEFIRIFETARTILESIESMLPDLPPSAIR
jgi:hypothetical protein